MRWCVKDLHINCIKLRLKAVNIVSAFFNLYAINKIPLVDFIHIVCFNTIINLLNYFVCQLCSINKISLSMVCTRGSKYCATPLLKQSSCLPSKCLRMTCCLFMLPLLTTHRHIKFTKAATAAWCHCECWQKVWLSKWAPELWAKQIRLQGPGHSAPTHSDRSHVLCKVTERDCCQLRSLRSRKRILQDTD